ncbi:MAG: ATPase [Candidatus Magnetoglobus multicellularis str. Araruama]|uniref:ATPase n=1 Tax=Candidatus Magnetoglobus multicellularis str. Araruama TaxID=890399 RepID=A0A1V1NZG2_9BACT|nr:MAG: ATPase [Candidatus Magnetoglobus multicellularis str. Araruama]
MEKKPYENIYNRSIMNTIIRKMSLKEILVITGVRRSGKSTLFKLLINHLIQTIDASHILYINFDDPYFSEICNDAKKIYDIIETSEKLTTHKIKYLLLDEIQNVIYWEKFVKSVYDSESFEKICITGSNSNLLKGEYARLISGRYIVNEIFPFSFQEILSIHDIKSYAEIIENKPKVLMLLDTFLKYGGFPELLKHSDTDMKREIIVNYFETIALKDCIFRGKIRDIKKFNNLLYYIISNIGALYSYRSLSKAVECSDMSVREFISNLEDSFLIYETLNFSPSLKKQIRSKKKVYCIDNGFLWNVSFRISLNSGILLENLVFSELLKRNKKVYFYNEQTECDFVFKNKENFHAIQVCFELNHKNRKREMSGLMNAMKKFATDKGFIITYNQEEKIDNVFIMPFWKFFGMDTLPS